jgi:hypothetical protein
VTETRYYNIFVQTSRDEIRYNKQWNFPFVVHRQVSTENRHLTKKHILIRIPDIGVRVKIWAQLLPLRVKFVRN